MFQTRTSQILATLLLLASTAMPLNAHATEPATPVAQAPAAVPNTVVEKKAYTLPDIDLNKLRFETKVTISEKQQWVKDQAAYEKMGALKDDIILSTDRLQDRLSPAGASLKASLKHKLPGTSLAQRGDRTVTVYGLILILSFAIVLFLMSLASPASRLGGRH